MRMDGWTDGRDEANCRFGSALKNIQSSVLHMGTAVCGSAACLLLSDYCCCYYYYYYYYYYYCFYYYYYYYYYYYLLLLLLLLLLLPPPPPYCGIERDAFSDLRSCIG